MILFALGSLLLGILCGYFLFPPEAVPVMDRLMSYALMLLLLSVGIEVGTNKTVFRKIREYNVRILVIPFGVAVGSIAGGLLLGFFLGMPVNESAGRLLRVRLLQRVGGHPAGARRRAARDGRVHDQRPAGADGLSDDPLRGAAFAGATRRSRRRARPRWTPPCR